jgi:hypothetical protein
MDARALLQVLQVAGNAALAAPDPERYPVSRDGIERLRQDFRAWHVEHRLPAIRSLNRAWTALCDGHAAPRVGELSRRVERGTKDLRAYAPQGLGLPRQ